MVHFLDTSILWSLLIIFLKDEQKIDIRVYLQGYCVFFHSGSWFLSNIIVGTVERLSMCIQMTDINV